MMRSLLSLCLLLSACTKPNPDYCPPDNFEACARAFFAARGWEWAADLNGYEVVPLRDMARTWDSARMPRDLAVREDIADPPPPDDLAIPPDLTRPPDLYEARCDPPPDPNKGNCRWDSDCKLPAPICVGARSCADVDLRIGWASGRCCAHPDCCIDAAQPCNGGSCCPGLTCTKQGPSFVCR